MKPFFLAVFVASVLLGGCASPLTAMEKSEYQSYEVKGLLVEEKDAGAGVAFGILPGGGSFYTRNYGYGILNLLLWPASILWDPVSGYNGAENINLAATRASVTTKKDREMRAIDDQLALGTMSKEDYIRQKHDIESRYSAP